MTPEEQADFDKRVKAHLAELDAAPGPQPTSGVTTAGAALQRAYATVAAHQQEKAACQPSADTN